MAAGGDSGGGSAAAGAQAPAQGQVHDWVSSAEWQAASAAAAARSWGAGSDRPDLAKAYLKHFCERFEVEVARAHSAHNSASHSGQAAASGTHHHNGNADDEEHEATRQSHKYFFRRLSFKGLRRGKGLFHKQHSDEVELSGHSGRQAKTKLAKIVVECRKEGLVNYLTPESLEQPTGPHKWEKCRLALVKTVGGYMLEFYSPPKSDKPRSGVFCFLITDARETTALEMPDHENTFVLKADNNMEYVIEAHDSEDMRSWLATVRYCMRSAPTSQPPPGALAAATAPVEATAIAEAAPVGETAASAPDLPPRRPGDCATSTSNFQLCNDTMVEETVESGGEPEQDLAVQLRNWPWFHGTLARSDAAVSVLIGGAANHGVYLVRQSETRRGEFVLTFNFQGRAKHLRMTLNDMGQCRVQHLWFPNIYDMLEHFRQNPIPLESGGTADVTLTEYVINNPQHRQLGATHGSDVRLRRSELEAMWNASAAGAGNETTPDEEENPNAPLHAVDNQYSFV